MKQNITVMQWLVLPKETRTKLLYTLKLPKTGIPETLNNSIVCDGVTTKDLLSFNIGKMIEYLGVVENAPEGVELCDYLFNKVVNKINDKEPEEAAFIGGADFSPISEEPVKPVKPVEPERPAVEPASEPAKSVKPARRGRPKKTKSAV